MTESIPFTYHSFYIEGEVTSSQYQVKLPFLLGVFVFIVFKKEQKTHHISICVEYSVEPKSTSGGRYHSVTTSLLYVLVGTDLARAKPKSASCKKGHLDTLNYLYHTHTY